MITIVLSGRFRIEDEDRIEITLRSRKAIALVALLATAPDLRRERAWICGKLWSDRREEHAKASLRQTVLMIRRALDQHMHLLDADRQFISLRKDQVRLLEVPGRYPLDGFQDVDPAFDEWLQAERRRRSFH